MYMPLCDQKKLIIIIIAQNGCILDEPLQCKIFSLTDCEIKELNFLATLKSKVAWFNTSISSVCIHFTSCSRQLYNLFISFQACFKQFLCWIDASWWNPDKNLIVPAFDGIRKPKTLCSCIPFEHSISQHIHYYKPLMHAVSYFNTIITYSLFLQPYKFQEKDIVTQTQVHFASVTLPTQAPQRAQERLYF